MPELTDATVDAAFWQLVHVLGPVVRRIAQAVSRDITNGTVRDRIIDHVCDPSRIATLLEKYDPDRSDFARHLAARIRRGVRSAYSHETNRNRLLDIYRSHHATRTAAAGEVDTPELIVLADDLLTALKQKFGPERLAVVLHYEDDDNPKSDATRKQVERTRKDVRRYLNDEK